MATHNSRIMGGATVDITPLPTNPLGPHPKVMDMVMHPLSNLTTEGMVIHHNMAMGDMCMLHPLHNMAIRVLPNLIMVVVVIMANHPCSPVCNRCMLNLTDIE
jgi:hypothetical protein